MNNDQRVGDTEILSSQNPPQPGGTRWGNVVLTFLGVCGFILTMCCGVAYFHQSTTLDPAKIAALQKEIVEITLPASLHPGLGINKPLRFTKMKLVFYNPNQATSLMLIGFLDSDESDYERSMKSCHDHANEYWKTDFQVESTETKSIPANGTPHDYQFTKGRIILPGGRTTPGRLIFGQFRAKNNRTGFMRYSIEESVYDETAVIKMLESIRLSPGGPS